MKSDDDRIERGDLRRTLDMDGTLDFDCDSLGPGNLHNFTRIQSIFAKF